MKIIKGFSLIELVIVIVLITIVATASATFLTQGLKNYTSGEPIIPLAGKTNLAVDNLMRELLSAGSISTIGTTTLVFINELGETITIGLSGTTLQRTSSSGGGIQTLCTNVTALTFAHFDSAFATTAIAANVSFVTIAITVTDRGIPYSLIAGTLIRRKL